MIYTSLDGKKGRREGAKKGGGGAMQNLKFGEKRLQNVFPCIDKHMNERKKKEHNTGS